MRRCVACDATFVGADWKCPECGWAPERKGSFLLFSPGSVSEEGGFDPSSFARLAAAEDGNFWFRARNRLVIWAFSRYGAHTRSFLEIGCGTGYVLQGLRAGRPTVTFVGGELFPEALPFAATRLPGVPLLQFDARRIPFQLEFDGIGAFDVLEHVVEDQVVLNEMYRAIRPGGLLMITVPQHPFLWTGVDEVSHHVRRYKRSEIVARIEAAGFEIVRTSSFNSLLMPLMLFSRWLRRLQRWRNVVPDELELGRMANTVFGFFMWLEYGLIRSGLSLPWGGSRLVVASKADEEERP